MSMGMAEQQLNSAMQQLGMSEGGLPACCQYHYATSAGRRPLLTGLVSLRHTSLFKAQLPTNAAANRVLIRQRSP
jgi:hypothetical protein